MNYRQYLEGYIAKGQYVLDDIVYKIDRMYIENKLSEADRDALIALATDSVVDSQQIDMYEKLVDLEHRIVQLETADFAVWASGYSTKKGETVKYDYDGDGVLDLLRYDGGRSYTTLSPGKIDGWHVVDSTGIILGTWYKGEFTPVEEAEA